MAETCKAIHPKNRADLHLLITWALWWVVPIIQLQMQVKIQRNCINDADEARKSETLSEEVRLFLRLEYSEV